MCSYKHIGDGLIRVVREGKNIKLVYSVRLSFFWFP